MCNTALDNAYYPATVTDDAGGQHDWVQPQHLELSQDVFTSTPYRAASPGD